MTNTDPPRLPALPSSGKEIYNSIMQQIEPELILPTVHTLKEKYAEESTEKKRERMERYKKAFTQYREKYEEVKERLQGSLDEYMRAVLDHTESLYKKGKEQMLKEIEDSMSQIEQ